MASNKMPKEVVMKSTADLIPYSRNSRTHSKDQINKIRASIREFGFTNPILIDAFDNIIAGHGRVMAAKAEGIETLPCLIIDYMTEAQKKAYTIADNRLALDAGWDEELLKLELIDLKDSFGFDVGLTGFDLIELDKLMALNDEVQEDDFDAEAEAEKIQTPVTQFCDIWVLGRSKLLCGDSTTEDVLKLMDGQKADMILTDPPYNVAYEGKTKEALTIQNDKMDNDAFRAFLRDAFAQGDKVLKKGGVFYIWHADSEGYNFRGACFDVGWKVRQCLIWHKNTMVMGRQDYHWKHEPCLYGWKDGASHLWAADRKQTTILDFERPSRNAEHPTMKPVKLFDYQIKNNTKGDDIVLDLFLGSGTTLIACEQNGRICRGLELDPVYCDVIAKRYIKMAGPKDVKLIRNGEEVEYSFSE